MAKKVSLYELMRKASTYRPHKPLLYIKRKDTKRYWVYYCENPENGEEIIVKVSKFTPGRRSKERLI